MARLRLLNVTAAIVAVIVGAVIAGIQLRYPVLALMVAGSIAVVYAGLDPWKGLVLLFLAAQFSGYKYNYADLTFRPGQLIFIGAMFGAGLFFLSRRSRLYSTILDIPILALIGLGLVSSYLYSPDTTHSYQSIFLQAVYAGMYFFTVHVLLNHRDKIDTMTKVVMVVAVLHAAFGMAALGLFFVGINISDFSSNPVEGYTAAKGFFEEGNLMGAFGAVMAIVFAAQLVTQGNRRVFSSRFLIAGLTILLLVTMASMTRAAWIGFAVALVVLPFYSKPRWNVINPQAVAFIGILVIGFIVVLLPLTNIIFTATSGHENSFVNRIQNVIDFSSGSGAGRLDVQERAILEDQHHPIIGTGVLSLRTEGAEGGWLYSSMAQTLYDTGIIGALLMLWIHLAPVAYGLWASTKAQTPFRKASLAGLSLGAVTMMVASQASSFFWLEFPWIYLGLLMALAKATIDDSWQTAAEA